MTDRLEKWIADHAAGLSTHQIAVKYGVGQTTVWSTLRDAGFQMAPVSARERAREFDESILEDYKEGHLVRDIAARYNTTLYAISQIRAEYGLPPRRDRPYEEPMRISGVSLGAIGPLLKALPKEDFDLLLAAAAARRKTVAQVLIEDWEAE